MVTELYEMFGDLFEVTVERYAGNLERIEANNLWQEYVEGLDE